MSRAIVAGIENPVPGTLEVYYKGIKIRDPMLIDILVDDRIIVEVKATEKDHPIYDVQLLTYLEKL